MGSSVVLSFQSSQVIARLLGEPELAHSQTFERDALKTISREQLMMVKGVGEQKANRVLREIELAMTATKEEPGNHGLGADFIDFYAREIASWSPEMLEALIQLPLLPDFFSNDYVHVASIIALLHGRSVPTFLDAVGINKSLLRQMQMFSESDIGKIANESGSWVQPLLLLDLEGVINWDEIYLTIFFELASKKELSYSEFQDLSRISSKRILEILNRDFLNRISGLSKNAWSYRLTVHYILEFKNGKSLRSIGERFGCTGENVRRRMGHLGVSASGVREERRAIEAEEARKIRRESRSIRPEVFEYLREYPGSTRSEICEHFHLTFQILEESLGGNTSLVLDEEFRGGIWQSESESLQATRRGAIRALREASNILPKLTAPKYDDLLRSGRVQGPSSARIHQVFESWLEACSIAGVEVGQRGRAHYERVWSEEDLIEFVAQFLQDTEGAGTVEGYNEWREEMGTEETPSVGTIMNYVSRSWILVRAKTLLMLRAGWDVSLG
jgi:hypothetical protein